jgi:hypothetical protein
VTLRPPTTTAWLAEASVVASVTKEGFRLCAVARVLSDPMPWFAASRAVLRYTATV